MKKFRFPPMISSNGKDYFIFHVEKKRFQFFCLFFSFFRVQRQFELNPTTCKCDCFPTKSWNNEQKNTVNEFKNLLFPQMISSESKDYFLLRRRKFESFCFFFSLGCKDLLDFIQWNTTVIVDRRTMNILASSFDQKPLVCFLQWYE